jgi:hypothetical protein
MFLTLLRQPIFAEWAVRFAMAGKIIATKSARQAMVTRSSVLVNALINLVCASFILASSECFCFVERLITYFA